MKGHFDKGADRRRQLLLLTVMASSLAGCMTPRVETGYDEVSALVIARGGSGLDAASADGVLPPLADTSEKGRQDLRPLSLEQALRTALSDSPALQAEYAQLQISRADVLQAGLLKNPKLDTAVLAGITGDPTRFSLGAAYPVLDLVYRKGRIKTARADFKATQIEIAGKIVAHTHAVASAYLDLAKAETRVKAQGDLARAIRSQIEAVERLVASGGLDGAELAGLQNALAEAEIAHEAEIGERNAARTTLAGLIGAPLDSALSTNFDLLRLDAADSDIVASTARARKLRLDLVSAEQEVAVRKLALRKEGRLLPENGAELGLELDNEEGERFLGPSVSLEVPLFDRGKYRRAKAEAELAAAERRLRALDLAIVSDVRSAYIRLDARRKTALAHRDRLTSFAQAKAELAQAQFNAGSIGTADFLEAQLGVARARLSAIDAAAGYWDARRDLAIAIGAWPSNL